MEPSSRLPSLDRLVTFFGAGRVNLNSATPQVLALLGVTQRAVTTMAAFLAGPDGYRGTEDDRYFKGLSEVIPRLRDRGADSAVAAEWAKVIQAGRVTVRSEYYAVRIRAVRLANGRQFEIDAMVNADSSAAIVDWREVQPR